MYISWSPPFPRPIILKDVDLIVSCLTRLWLWLFLMPNQCSCRCFRAQKKTSWWFQPLWKICSSNCSISPSRGENKESSKQLVIRISAAAGVSVLNKKTLRGHLAQDVGVRPIATCDWHRFAKVEDREIAIGNRKGGKRHKSTHQNLTWNFDIKYQEILDRSPLLQGPMYRFKISLRKRGGAWAINNWDSQHT